MSVEPFVPGAPPPGVQPGTGPLQGMPTAVVTRQREELTPEIVAAIKETLVQIGLPPDIFKFTFDRDVYVFRPLLGRDWAEVLQFIAAHQGLTQEAIDHKICEKALLWPDVTDPIHWDMQRAGYQSSLAKRVMAHSGFYDPDLDQSAYLRVESLVEVEPGRKPTDAEVGELKVRFPNWPLKLVLVGTKWYVVRPLSRGEWKQNVPDTATQADIQLVAASRGTVWCSRHPEAPDFAQVPAGTVAALSQVVLYLSGFFVEPEVEAL